MNLELHLEFAIVKTQLQGKAWLVALVKVDNPRFGFSNSNLK